MTLTARLLLRWVSIVVVSTLCLPLAVPAAAQRVPTPLSEGDKTHNSDEAAWEAQQQKDLAKKFNLQRQQELKKDSEKLLELATELKQSVDKTNENTLSLDVIKKADQIEKLAKSIRDKMKGP